VWLGGWVAGWLGGWVRHDGRTDRKGVGCRFVVLRGFVRGAPSECHGFPPNTITYFAVITY